MPPHPTSTDSAPTAALSETEYEILRLVATGATNREIAHVRTISEATVKKHLTNINAKLGTANRTEAMRRALDMGLIVLGDPAEGTVDEHEGRARGEGMFAARLAEELARARRRTRRAVAWTVGGALVAIAAVVAAAVWRVSQPPTTPTPAPTAQNAPAAAWLLGRQLPEARTGLAAVSDAADLYVIAGATDGGRLVTTTLRYSLGGTLDWQRRSPKPTAARDVAGVSLRGKIVVPGGCGADGRAIATVEIYDPPTDRWSAAAPLPDGHAVCGYGIAVLSGWVYLFGGRSGPDAASASDAILRYDLAADTWTVMPDRLLRPRADMAAAAFEDREGIHLVGGRGPSGQLENNHWVYRPFTPAAERWDETAAPLPEGRAGHALAMSSSPREQLFLVGGGWDAHLDVGTLMYDLETGRWAPFDVVRGYTPDRGAALAVLGRQQLVLVGGQRLNGEPLRQAYLRTLKYEISFPSGGQR